MVQSDAVRHGDKLHVEVQSINLAGAGVGRAAERPVEVPGAFAGERALVRIEHVQKRTGKAFAKLLDLQRAHPDRREPPCPNHAGGHGRCTGCALMELDEGAQRLEKRHMLEAHFGLEVDEVEAPPAALGYRYSAKRVAFGSAGRMRLGSYVRGTHKPARMPGCLVDHPAIAAAADAIEAAAQRVGVAAFDERSGHGDLRYVWLKTDGAQVLATFITVTEDETLARALADAVPELAGIAWSVQPNDGNAVRGSEPVLLRGAATLTVDASGAAVAVGPLGFLQPNPVVAGDMYRALVAGPDGEALERGDAFDLYAGAGVTTAMLRERMHEVTPCEAYPESAAALGVEPEHVADFLARQEQAPTLVVANPPRKGLGAAVVTELRRLGAPRLHILACGPAALARDLSALTAEGPGAYRLERLRAFDTLPQTPHVELLAFLSRAPAEPTEEAAS